VDFLELEKMISVLSIRQFTLPQVLAKTESAWPEYQGQSGVSTMSEAELQDSKWLTRRRAGNPVLMPSFADAVG
jgi:hypothetical protein